MTLANHWLTRWLAPITPPKGLHDPLEDVLWTWPDGSPFTVRNILSSIEVKSVTGGGKSSGSGKFITEAIIRHPKSTCFIICMKPEDKDFYLNIFNRYNKPVAVIEEGCEWRCNSLQAMVKAGAGRRPG